MNIEIRCLNATPIYDLQEAKLITISKKPVKRDYNVDELIDTILTKHSFLKTVIYRIRLKDCDKDVRNQLVRHTTGNPVFACESSRKDFPSKRERTDNVSDWLGDWNIIALLNMMKQRLCQNCEKNTRDVAFEIRKMFVQSEDVLMKAIGCCMVPTCVAQHGCSEHKKCGFYEKHVSWNQEWFDNNDVKSRCGQYCLL